MKFTQRVMIGTQLKLFETETILKHPDHMLIIFLLDTKNSL